MQNHKQENKKQEDKNIQPTQKSPIPNKQRPSSTKCSPVFMYITHKNLDHLRNNASHDLVTKINKSFEDVKDLMKEPKSETRIIINCIMLTVVSD